MSQPTPFEQRQFICTKIDELEHQDRVCVYRFIQTHCPGAKFCRHSDGCSINIDKLPDDLIASVYAMIKKKLDA